MHDLSQPAQYIFSDTPINVKFEKNEVNIFLHDVHKLLLFIGQSINRGPSGCGSASNISFFGGQSSQQVFSNTQISVRLEKDGAKTLLYDAQIRHSGCESSGN
ncbi:hypothetical protein CDL12_01422 [Handroanthus impetiginosus]|uniref:Uncharacterized protein n=1 Tax=Handroanthus impetiginosus TaxID=429701 RepID=A0A2G9I7W7_9LAMI|nr:hypothetical protein CDL12_01422 [Handroanthus impetiginosus]